MHVNTKFVDIIILGKQSFPLIKLYSHYSTVSNFLSKFRLYRFFPFTWKKPSWWDQMYEPNRFCLLEKLWVSRLESTECKWCMYRSMKDCGQEQGCYNVQCLCFYHKRQTTRQLVSQADQANTSDYDLIKYACDVIHIDQKCSLTWIKDKDKHSLTVHDKVAGQIL